MNIDPDLIGPGLILVRGIRGSNFHGEIPIDQVAPRRRVPQCGPCGGGERRKPSLEEWVGGETDSFGPDDGRRTSPEEFIGPSLVRTARRGSSFWRSVPDQIAILEGSPETPEL